MKNKRTLTVEAFGEHRKTDASTIRLKGQWLRRLGFAPGMSVDLTAISPGVLEIRLCSVPKPNEGFQITAHRLDVAIALDKARKENAK